MTTTYLSRGDLLASARKYDRWRDGTDAIPLGATAHTQLPYTGAHMGLRVGDTDPLAKARMAFYVRTHADEFDAAIVDSIDHMREARTPADHYDWDCHKCQTAVYTESLTDACPHCLLD